MRRADIRRFKGIEPQIDTAAYIDTETTIIGDVTIGAESSVWPRCVLRGDVNSIKIGQKTNIQDGSILHVTHKSPANPDGNPLIIGDGVTVGHKVVLHGCIIEDGSFVGMGAIVMDRAVIEAGGFVAAGALVTENTRVKSGWIYGGIPAKPLRELSDAEKAHLVYSANNYVSYAKEAKENYQAI